MVEANERNARRRVFRRDMACAKAARRLSLKRSEARRRRFQGVAAHRRHLYEGEKKHARTMAMAANSRSRARERRNLSRYSRSLESMLHADEATDAGNEA